MTVALPLDGNYRSIGQVVGTPVTASATAAAGAANSATLPAAAGLTTYLTGFTILTNIGGVAGSVSGVVTITGLLGGTWSIQFTNPGTTGNYGGELEITLLYPIPASAPNTAIVVSLPAITNAGASSIAVTGFQL